MVKGDTFLIFGLFFQYNFGDSGDIHGMRPIILGYFLPAIPIEISEVFNSFFKCVFRMFLDLCQTETFGGDWSGDWSED